MTFFISGTDTGVGKTAVASWLCAHTGYGYFKPIQTGSVDGTDGDIVSELAQTTVYPIPYAFKRPLSPHLAARYENASIDIDSIELPAEKGLIVEGAGGVLVPIDEKHYMADLVVHFGIPVILVARTKLGTINHTVLSLEALRSRGLEVCGVITCGEANEENGKAIEHYGQVRILGHLPFLDEVSYPALLGVPLPISLRRVLWP